MMIQEAIQQRYSANKEILKRLSEYIELHPEQRFQQILINLKIVDPNKDGFYEESIITKNRLK